MDNEQTMRAWGILVELPSLYDRAGGPLGWNQNRKLNKAKKLLDAALAENPEDPRSHWGLATVEHLQNNIEAAWRLMEPLATHFQNEPLYFYECSQLLMALGKGAEADEAARFAVQLAPENPELKVHYALALVLTGDTKRAFGVIANVYKTHPEEHRARLVLDRIKKMMNGQAEIPKRFTAQMWGEGDF